MAPVDTFGALQVKGNKVCAANGAPVQLRGMSLFWSQWSQAFWNKTMVSNQVDQWKANIIRCAMGVEQGGYLTDRAASTNLVKTIVDQAIARGIYVIIDWHDHNADTHTNDAVAFFTEMAQLYGKTPNVIFEVFNEPTNQSWGAIKAYAETVIGAIRGAGSTNLVIVGSREWSQRVDEAAANPITRFSNVAYTLHFYAATHTGWLRSRADAAMQSGIAIFVTEYGTCAADGNGNVDEGETRNWFGWMDANSISSCNWSLFDKPEAASAIMPNMQGGTTGPWTDNMLTQSGKLVRGYIMNNSTPPPPPPGDLPSSITLKAKANGMFVCADNAGASALIANRTSASTWETFDTVNNGDGTYSFKSRINGKFVCADNYGNNPLIANRTAASDWEKFYVIKNSDQSISLKAKVNNKYVCADNFGKSPLIANRTGTDTWEQFWVAASTAATHLQPTGSEYSARHGKFAFQQIADATALPGPMPMAEKPAIMEPLPTAPFIFDAVMKPNSDIVVELEEEAVKAVASSTCFRRCIAASPYLLHIATLLALIIYHVLHRMQSQGNM